MDFKTSDSGTLDAVVKALQPLRDGGYLSHLENGKFVERQITVVASGNAPVRSDQLGERRPQPRRLLRRPRGPMGFQVHQRELLLRLGGL